MNSMVDFVSNFNLFMNPSEPEQEEQPQQKDTTDHNLHDREKPKYKKKPLKQIFRMNENEIKKYSRKK